MPYIECPLIDWNVNDNLYNRFLQWKLKCKNILECELAMLSGTRTCKKVIAWSGDFGIDQYVSWCLPPEEVCLDVIWSKFGKFCKLQTNEIRARFDLLTSFRQGDCSVDEWYNAIQAEINLAKHLQEMAKILHRDIFWFFLRDEEFVSKTINDSNIDVNKFPASKVRQMARKLESSKATAKHIKQVATEPQATQINLLRHQCTELPPSKFQRRQKKLSKSRQVTNKQYHEDKNKERMLQVHGRFHKNQQAHTSPEDRCSKCGDAQHIKGFSGLASRFQCKIATNLSISAVYVTRKRSQNIREI